MFNDFHMYTVVGPVDVRCKSFRGIVLNWVFALGIYGVSRAEVRVFEIRANSDL